MGYNFPARPQNQILQGVKIVNGEVYMREDSEVRYVYGQPYLNTKDYQIIIL